MRIISCSSGLLPSKSASVIAGRSGFVFDDDG